METVRFEEMGLSEEIQKAVRYMGFEEASPIQAKAIPAMISGIDLIGQAQTGTGKTAAFGIPILEKVDPKLKKTCLFRFGQSGFCQNCGYQVYNRRERREPTHSYKPQPSAVFSEGLYRSENRLHDALRQMFGQRLPP